MNIASIRPGAHFLFLGILILLSCPGISASGFGQELKDRIANYLQNKETVCSSCSLEFLSTSDENSLLDANAGSSEMAIFQDLQKMRFSGSEVFVTAIQRAVNSHGEKRCRELILFHKSGKKSSMSFQMVDSISLGKGSEIVTKRVDGENKKLQSVSRVCNPFELPMLNALSSLNERAMTGNVLLLKEVDVDEDSKNRDVFWLLNPTTKVFSKITFAYKPTWLVEEFDVFVRPKRDTPVPEKNVPKEIESKWKLLAHNETKWKELPGESTIWVPVSIDMKHSQASYACSRKILLRDWDVEREIDPDLFDPEKFDAIDFRNIDWTDLESRLSEEQWDGERRSGGRDR